MKNNVRVLMGEQGVTNVEALIDLLPEDQKLSRCTIYRIMRGKEPSARAMLILAGFFQKEVSEVFEIDSNKVFS